MRSRLHAASAIIAACAATDAVAATPGVAEPPAPGPLPYAWIELANDDIASFERPALDDHRTHQTEFANRVGDAAIVDIDHSILTDRPSARRSDELTAIVGWLPYGDGAGDKPRVMIGGGARLSGHLLGQELQDDCHSAQDYRCYELPYDPPHLTAVASASANAPWFPHPDAGFEGFADVVVTSWIAAAGDIGARAILRGEDEKRAWLAVRQHVNDGAGQSWTARATAAFERGTWIEYGASWRVWTLSGGVNCRDRFSYGAIGLTVTSW